MKKNRMLLILILILFLCLGVAGGYLFTHANIENLLSWNISRWGCVYPAEAPAVGSWWMNWRYTWMI